MYLDANNLYGCVMSQYLPSGGFKWMIKEKTEKLNLSKYTEDSKEGLMLIFIITTHLLLKKSP